MVLGCISAYGVGSLHVLLNAERYIKAPVPTILRPAAGIQFEMSLFELQHIPCFGRLAFKLTRMF